MKTIQEIKGEHSTKIGDLMNSYMDRKDEIAALREVESGGYLDRLTDEQKANLLLEQKMEKATAVHEDAAEKYVAQLEGYRTELEKRKGYIKEHLFKVEDAGALSRAATATDAELGAMLEIAALSQNAELGRAVFVAAEQRELSGVMLNYFEKINPEGRELYAEWCEIQPQEVLDRQLENVATVLPPPDPNGLMPLARL
jgi:hypothetical protein